MRIGIYARVSTVDKGQDVEVLAKEFFPEFTMEDLVSLPRYHIYLRLMIDGGGWRGFSAITLSPGTSQTV